MFIQVDYICLRMCETGIQRYVTIDNLETKSHRLALKKKVCHRYYKLLFHNIEYFILLILCLNLDIL